MELKYSKKFPASNEIVAIVGAVVAEESGFDGSNMAIECLDGADMRFALRKAIDLGPGC